MIRVAYFSMEIAVDPALPTYSGGLGMLAGDSVRSAADLRVPLCAVTLLHRKGYFRQRIDESGWQHEEPVAWDVERELVEEPARAGVIMEGRAVQLRAWRRDVRGVSGGVVPVYFIDADLAENDTRDRGLTDYLYGGDQRYRFCQEVILGVGGVRLLRALGHASVERFHMNEGHSALLAAELLREHMLANAATEIDGAAVEAVRRRCVFTTHTPVAAGHDSFPSDLVRPIVGAQEAYERSGLFEHEGHLNMTHVALNLSGYVNAVAKRHGEVSRAMFPGRSVESITNGVHAATWVCAEMAELFDAHVPGWREDNALLRHALSLPSDEVLAAHLEAKRRLLEVVRERTGVRMHEGVCTLGFARRSTAYKRPDLLLSDRERLRKIARAAGGLQIVYAGKAHPRDTQGKEIIRQVLSAAAELRGGVEVAFVPEYDFAMGKLLTAGVDVWVNNPEPPLEASGTSGMKAALNGVPQLSTLDGWWLEGCFEGLTGWAIGEGRAGERERDAASLYEKLEGMVLPLYRDQERWARLMRHAVALNGSFFNTQRMMQEYVTKAYFR